MRSGKGSFTENAIIVNRGYNVVHVKVHVQSFNMFLILFPSVFVDRVIHFEKNLGDQVKGRS